MEDNNEFICSKCNKTFKRQKNLENHEKVCNGNKCEIGRAHV